MRIHICFVGPGTGMSESGCMSMKEHVGGKV